MNFARFLRTLFYRTPPDDCFCLDLVVANYQKSKADILWLSNRSELGAQTIVALIMVSCFKLRLRSTKLKLDSTKLKYLRQFGLAPYFKSLLVERLKKSAYYIVSFDESFNMIQSCEIDLLVRYFDKTELH